MISLITTLKNRADLLEYGLESILLQDFWKNNPTEKLEINIGDGGSTDDLDSLLLNISKRSEIQCINKYIIDRQKSKHHHIFNCPAEEYNILVKLSSSSLIIKIDPEIVVLDESFISKANAIVSNSHSIVIPFPIHCYDFELKSISNIKNNYPSNVYRTHITLENMHKEIVYYCCMFKKEDYLNLGGVDERFINGIGSEDLHFLDAWRKKYGSETVVPLADYHCLHLWHGEWGNGVPSRFMPWVALNESLRNILKNEYPNQNLEWGTLYTHIEKIQFKGGNCFIC